MKKLINISIVCLIIFSGALKVQAQDPGNIIKVNYLSLVVSTINVAYEKGLSEKTSGQFQFYYWMGGKVGDVQYGGFGVTPEFRFYPSGNALRGFFLGPFIRYQNWSIEDTEPDPVSGLQAKGTYQSFGGGVVLGGQFVFGDVVSLDIWGGPAFNSGSVTYEDNADGNISVTGDGFTFRFGTTVGLAF